MFSMMNARRLLLLSAAAGRRRSSASARGVVWRTARLFSSSSSLLTSSLTNDTASLTSYYQQQQQQQVRLFSKKKGFQPNNKGGGNKITLKLCYSPTDFDDDDNDLVTVHSKSSLHDIQKSVANYIGWEEINVIEYYDTDTDEWKELKNPSQLLGGGGGGVKSIRVPELYEEYDDDDEEEFNEDFPYDDDMDDGLYAFIKELVDDLKQDGYSTAAEKAGQLVDNSSGATVSSKEYILKRAQDDTELQRILVSYPGALNHIVECLDYDFLWKEKEEEEEDGISTSH